jgi:putative protease
MIDTAKPNQPELLAPAGNWDCARAAVANGADAIYFGMPKFNARMRADNFTEEDLPELMTFLHAHGVRGFVAFNVLAFTRELDAVAEQIKTLAAAGVDAVIVQDIGIAKMVRLLAPQMHLHASTQMTITSPEGLAFINRELGLDRAVLSRELSLRELQRFDGSVPLEVFVHGALCVAYSGQCLTSEALGQRSANRGECAQACRMPYDLIVDGQQRDLGDLRYLLSPQDFAAVDQIPDLLERGVVSFKIEGRLKSPEYVAAVTSVYRKALDGAKATAADKYALEMTFSRGLTSGWLEGTDHPKLTHGRFGKKRGAFIGIVSNIGYDWVELEDFETPVKANDGIVFDIGENPDHEQGCRVFAVGENRITLVRGKVDTREITIGARIWKTSDVELERALRKSWTSRLERPRTGNLLDFRVSGKVGTPLTLEIPAHNLSIDSTMPLQAAQNRPLDGAALTKQLSRLGDTIFALGTIENLVEGDVILPLSELNKMRRDLVDQVPDEQRPVITTDWRTLLPAEQPKSDAEPTLTILCRNFEQLDAALAANISTIYCDFEDIRRYKDAVVKVRNSGSESKIYLATPRIQKAGETGYFRLIKNAQPDGVLVRNLGAIDSFADSGLPLIGDFSLNVANPITADFFKSRGLKRLTVSYDLNITQVLDILTTAPAAWFEITLHQHMPMFHMEHCVFCTFMSEGTDYTNCGRPCEKHDVQLRDRVGQLHTLSADVGCRNTLYRGQAQSGARFYESMRAAGARSFRLELLRETTEKATELIESYQGLLNGTSDPSALFTRLNIESKLGVVEGTLL